MTRQKIFLSAGEASGDHYGSLLIEALRRLAPQAEFFGLGGPQMERAGQRRIIRAEDVAVMGFTEVVAHLPRIYAHYRTLTASLRQERPSLAILIDFPDVNLRLAEQLHRIQTPVVYFVSPQLWAWKKRRINRVRSFVDRMLVIFPFEENFYRERGIDADFVGHPLAEMEPPGISREAFARESGLDSSKMWIGLLPGSRKKELQANLPPMLEAAHQLGPKYEFVLPVAPTLQDSDAEAVLQRSWRAAAPRTGMGQDTSRPAVRLVRDARAALFHARASVVASGTATVEAAILGNPFLVVYRVSPLSYAVARRIIDVPHVGMVNLIAGREIVPELIQSGLTASNIVHNLKPLLEDGPARATMQSDLKAVAAALRKGSSLMDRTAIERAANIALGLVDEPEKSQLSVAPVEERPCS